MIWDWLICEFTKLQPTDRDSFGKPLTNSTHVYASCDPVTVANGTSI